MCAALTQHIPLRSGPCSLELMVPNEAFAEFVRAGEDTGNLSGDDLCVLAAIGCR